MKFSIFIRSSLPFKEMSRESEVVKLTTWFVKSNDLKGGPILSTSIDVTGLDGLILERSTAFIFVTIIITFVSAYRCSARCVVLQDKGGRDIALMGELFSRCGGSLLHFPFIRNCLCRLNGGDVNSVFRVHTSMRR